MTEDEYIRRGRSIISLGLLKGLRTQLGLTRNAMSELLHTSPVTYATWEDRPEVRVWGSTAARVGRFYERATRELELLTEQGYELEGLVPFHLAATMLGIPQELLLRRYRDGEVDAVDAGILGLWVRPTATETRCDRTS